MRLKCRESSFRENIVDGQDVMRHIHKLPILVDMNSLQNSDVKCTAKKTENSKSMCNYLASKCAGGSSYLASCAVRKDCSRMYGKLNCDKCEVVKYACSKPTFNPEREYDWSLDQNLNEIQNKIKGGGKIYVKPSRGDFYYCPFSPAFWESRPAHWATPAPHITV